MRLTASVCALSLAAAAFAQVGFVNFDGIEMGLTAYSNPTYTYTGTGLGTDASQVTPGTAATAWVAGDSFFPVSRGNVGPNNIGMPFNISDDSVAGAAGNTAFPTDVQGFAGQAFTNGFFGVTDTVNSVNTGPVTASFTFNIAGASNLGLSVDVAAMGDFELADAFSFSYSIDGGAFVTLLTSSVDETGSTSYIMDSGAVVSVDDPMYLNGVLLNDNYQNFAAAIAGTGSSLEIRFIGDTDGAEAFGFDNLKITPEPTSLALLVLGGLGFLRRR